MAKRGANLAHLQPDSDDERGRVYVSPEERRERENVVEQLLIAGVNKNQIAQELRRRFNTTPSATGTLIARVRKRWADEERENRPSYKAAAIRRITGHIAQARQSKNWAAVAQLERLMSEIQGTREPIEVQMNVDVSLPEAAMRVVATLPPEKFQAMIAEQRRLRALAPVATTGEEVKDR